MKARKKSSNSLNQHGFALVVALSMMAFVLVLLISMTLLINVETASSQISLYQLRAKESARLALMMALGDLQRYAGPDQRVTARAEILDNDFATANPFWTGVWDSADLSTSPRWMVSWQDQSSQVPPTLTLPVLGSGSGGSDSANYVSVPVIDIDKGHSVYAKIAWWVSDDGVKASAGNTPRNLRPLPNYLTAESFDALDLLVASSQGLESIFPNYDRFNSSGANHLDRVISYRQLLAQFDFLAADTDFSGEASYHSIAPFSLGVLSNTLNDADGGLMRDLSLFPQILGNGVEEFLKLGETHAEVQNQLGDTISAKRLFTQIQGLDAIGPLSDGDIATPIAPILSNFMMAFTIRSESPVASHPNFYLRMRFFCEFWNPYTNTLNMKDESNNDLELELEINGLPEVIVHKTTGTLDQSAPISIQNLTGHPSHPDRSMVIRLVNDTSQDWLPGQSNNWTGVDASRATGPSPYYSIQNDGKVWVDPDHNLGGSTGIDTFEPRLTGDIRHESIGTNNISVKVYLVNDATHERKLISTIDSLEYQPVSTRPTGYSNTHSGTKFGYHFILRGPHLSSDDSEYFRGRWLYDHDPRNPAPEFNPDWNLDNDPGFNSGSAYVPVKDGISTLLIPEPAEIFDPGTINTIIFRRFMDRSSGINSQLYNKLWQDAPLFELPRHRILSLASLQHLYFHNERPFQVGNSWGSDGSTNTSAWFDRYYLSGLSRRDNPNEFATDTGPTNPALIFYQTEDFANSLQNWQSQSAANTTAAKSPAELLMVANRFNINSTSVAAWKAVLSSLRLNDFEYLDYPEDDTSDLSSLTINQQSRVGSFARFSQSLAATYEAPATPAFEDTEPVAPSAFYRHGARRFDDDEFESFAQAIVNLIKERGSPFTSIESFLSAANGDDLSLIEKAIKTVFATSGRQQWDHLWEITGVRGNSVDIIDIDHFSPGFLTQADVLTAIGPMLAPRSDTFTIRTRGDSINLKGQSEATAYLEATFQRTPKTVDSTATPTDSSDRRFILISIRWLSEDEV
ncbi:hypothetical protein QEH59_08015 [Coraliomargarita sp. SDUM461004]|uniref:Type 4 fimbrial biogenesis protein PilX N-terminal domain-containing protein n=1 Tax=Thalassobacterium sedimentorum TaxID=3041258 RepID=A0ABU1AHS9_9BACT|nr:hypothetical protein [Coraliomargarita sp. SDUM461004]MDQ8194367.1 hypothetical protein [Coraliomargarita sp. SDUM461004]